MYNNATIKTKKKSGSNLTFIKNIITFKNFIKNTRLMNGIKTMYDLSSENAR